MRCHRCDYPLWNVKARACPDCGEPFRPSEHRFQQGGARFLCPHCETAYYGTSPEGHLIPRRFVCVGCQNPIDMDEMTVAPPEGLDAGHASIQNPWLNRTNFLSGYLQGLFSVLIKPVEFGRSLPQHAPLRDAATFFLVGVGISTAVNLLMQACILGTVAALLSAGPRPMPPIFGPMGITGQILQGVIIGLLFSCMGVVVESGLAHLLLKGGAARPVAYRRSVQAYCYGSGAGAAILTLQAVPCVGFLVMVGWFGWSIYVIGMLLRETYGVSTARAIWTMIGVRVASVVVAGLVMCGIFLLVPQLFGLPAGFTTRILNAGQAGGGATVGQTLRAYRVDNSRWPTTPLDPFANDPFSLAELVEMTRVTSGQSGGQSPGRGAIGNLQSGTIFMDDGRVFAAEQAALAAKILPGKPFRLGGAVFLYPIADPDPDAWLILTDGGGSQPFATVVTGRGREFVPLADLPARLEAENARRATAGLTPLPDTSTLPDLLAAPASPAPPATP